MDTIPPEFYGVGGPAAMLVGLFWMLARGTLVTRREADGIRQDRDDWKSAHATSETGRHVAEAQVTELLETARVNQAFVGAISQLGNRETP